MDDAFLQTIVDRYIERGDVSAVGLILIGIHIGLRLSERRRLNSLRPSPKDSVKPKKG